MVLKADKPVEEVRVRSGVDEEAEQLDAQRGSGGDETGDDDDRQSVEVEVMIGGSGAGRRPVGLSRGGGGRVGLVSVLFCKDNRLGTVDPNESGKERGSVALDGCDRML